MKNIKSTYSPYKRQIKLSTWLLFVTIVVQAQDIHFTFVNAQNTIENGNYYYEADIMIEATEAFKLGSGQMYLTYNQEAFGDNVSKQQSIAYGYEPGYILGESYVFPAYKSFIRNDNTTNRVSFAFQQGVSAESMTKANVTTTVKPLFHIKLKYVDATKDPMIAFEEGKIYQDQFFTACGSMLKSGAKAGFPDCANLPGKQLVNDTYDSSGASLEVLHVEEQNLDVIYLYPNPAKEYFLIKGLDTRSADINIIDINGKLVKQMKDYHLESIIQVSDLQSGVYVVQVYAEGIQKNYKLTHQ